MFFILFNTISFICFFSLLEVRITKDIVATTKQVHNKCKNRPTILSIGNKYLYKQPKRKEIIVVGNSFKSIEYTITLILTFAFFFTYIKRKTNKKNENIKDRKKTDIDGIP